MGCGASKESSVVQTTLPKEDKKEFVFHAEKEILPGIKGKETKAAVCFEIPLDNISNNTLAGSLSKSLPKLSQDLSKLANTEERWKELDSPKMRKKPVLSSSKKVAPMKLEDKEKSAALNRQREKERLTAKIAAQEERKRLVLERKKLLQDDENFERCSVGGENQSSSACSSSQSLESSRSGSGKSTLTETTDVEEGIDSYASSPESIKKIGNPIIQQKIRI
jgi:hypothetical protein